MSQRILPTVLFISGILLCGACGPAGDQGSGEGSSESAEVASDPAYRIPVRIGPVEEGAETYFLGEILPDLRVVVLGGGPTNISGLAKGRPFVIAVRDLKCPISKKYGPLLGRKSVKWRRDGVPFFYINTTLADDVEAMNRDRELFGLAGHYIPDKDMKIARLLKATSTTEVFVFDQDRRLVYRGALDDRYGFGVDLNAAHRSFIDEALTAVLRGDEPVTRATTAPGCFLDLSEPAMGDGDITFHEQIAPIVRRRCQRCHRPGENAPFDLVTYDDLLSRRGMIRYTVKNRVMPPWFADPHVGGPWLDDLRLTEDERNTMLAWLDQGCPEGKASRPLPPLPENEGWRIGKPDVVLEVPEEIHVQPEGLIPYVYEVVATEFPEDRWIQSIEVKNDVPAALHHILVFEYKGAMVGRNPNSLGGLALETYFAIKSPGVEPIQYPADRAKFVPKGMKLFFQIHYQAIGRPFKDRPKIAFKFAKKPPRYAVLCDAASTRQIIIPPGAPNYRIVATDTIPADGKILGFSPHMHARGKAFLYELIYPDGHVVPALRINDWDFNWQQSYRLEKPIPVPKGTIVRATAWFDNSADNPANPDPNATVLFGLQTDDEMMIGYYEWVRDDGKRTSD